MSNPLHISRYDEKKEQVREYLETPRVGRMPLAAFRQETGIRRDVYVYLKNILEAEAKEVAKANIRNIQENLFRDVEPEGKRGRKRGKEEKVVYVGGERFIKEEDELEEDPVGWWKKRTLEVNKAILESAKKGNAQSQKLAKQLAGELIEKAEVKIGLTGDELTRRQLEAERQLRELGFRGDVEHRVDKMQNELSILPQDVCLDTEQEHGSDS